MITTRRPLGRVARVTSSAARTGPRATLVTRISSVATRRRLEVAGDAAVPSPTSIRRGTSPRTPSRRALIRTRRIRDPIVVGTVSESPPRRGRRSFGQANEIGQELIGADGPCGKLTPQPQAEIEPASLAHPGFDERAQFLAGIVRE